MTEYIKKRHGISQQLLKGTFDFKYLLNMT